MYDLLKARLTMLLACPRPMKPQTERQLSQHMTEYRSGLPSFLLCAAGVLEEYELDILFGPIFTPTVQDRAQLAELLFHWRPTTEQLTRLVRELSTEISHTPVRLPDGTEAKLTLHEVMVERFVRLLRLEHAPEPATSASLRESLPADLWPLAIAMLCEPGITPAHQHWFSTFISHFTGRGVVTGKLLETIVEFVGRQSDLKPASLVAAAESLLKASEGTAAYAAAGHAYWSPDVAQHHHYRGQGNVDLQRVQDRQAEVECAAALLDGLRTLARGSRGD